MGRPIANESFFRALLQYGSYEKYDIFCPDVAHLGGFNERLDTLIEDGETRARVEVSVHAGLAEAIATREYGAFHFGDFTSLLPYVVALRNRQKGAPFPISGITHSLDGVLMSTRYIQLALAGLQSHDAIVCTSECAINTVRKGLDWAQERLGLEESGDEGAELAHIPLALEADAFPALSRAEARAFFRIPENKTVALSVGRFTVRHKGDWAPILERFAQMKSAGALNDVVIIVAGGGEESDVALFESLVKRMGLEDVVLPFPNFKPEVKSMLYASADFYFSIVDNFQETFGITNLEAMASGLPVIASSFNGYREVVQDGETGILIPTYWCNTVPEFIEDNLGIMTDSMAGMYLAQSVAVDLDAFEAAFRSFCSDEQMRDRMGKAGSERAKEYTWPRVIGRYEALWARLRQRAADATEVTLARELVVPPGHLYSHYTSERLTPDTLIGLTEVGSAYQGNRGAFIRYEDVQLCLFEALESHILTMLNAGPISLASLESSAHGEFEASKGQVSFHLMWLMKHGALKVVSPE